MKKYRKKPVVIEAIQFNGKNFNEVCNFMGEIPAQELNPNYNGDISTNGDYLSGLYIETLGGKMFANIGDYIIKGINGEFYPCKPDIFLRTYNEVAEEKIWNQAEEVAFELLSKSFYNGAKWALNNQWHDLIKNPNDLPDFKIYDWVLVTFRDNKDGVPHIAEYRNGVWNTFESYNGYWSSVKEVLGDAIAWMPMPEFKIKEE